MIIKNKKIVIPFAIIITLCSIMIFFQFAYPDNRALPQAKLFGKNVGYSKQSELQSQILDSFEIASVKIRAGNNQETIALKNLGANVNSEYMAYNLYNYPTIKKLIPFSIFFMKPDVSSFIIGFSSSEQNESLNNIQKKFNHDAIDAQISIKDGKISIEKGSDGVKISLDSLKKQILNTDYVKNETTINLKTEVIKPVTTEQTLSLAYSKATLMGKHKITINGQNNQQYVLDTDSIVKMLKIKTDPDKSVSVYVDQNLLAEHIKTIGSNFYQAPKSSQISLVDGEMSGTSEGASGKSIDSADLTQKIQVALESQNLISNIDAKFINVNPNAVYSRTYTNSQKGLQAYLDYKAQTNDIRVYIKQLDGNMWTAGVRQTQQTVSASTYKLYVSLLVFEKINKGEINLNTPILNTNVSGCLEEMLIISTNRCAEEWINQFGRENINTYIHSRGISLATTFTHQEAVQTSAQDLATVLGGINDGTLMSEPGRSMLLERLARQKWRSGIPAGTKGWVQDKVGFLWSYTHDVGLVHTQKGTYIMAVMTKNSSYANIAQITRDVESIMYP